MAVAHIRNTIPQLAATIEDGLDFAGEGAGGELIVASRKGGKWKTKAREVDRSCLVMDTTDAEKYLRNRLKKHGMLEAEIGTWAKQFRDCDNGKELRLPTGEIVVKNEATVQIPRLTERHVDNRVAVLIAFEFLALCLGHAIYERGFDAIRDYIRNGTKTEHVQVLNKATRRYRPMHTVRFQIREKDLTVFVQFFGWYVFEVTFRDILLPSQEVVYVEDLKNKQSLMALSLDDARHGSWTAL